VAKMTDNTMVKSTNNDL